MDSIIKRANSLIQWRKGALLLCALLVGCNSVDYTKPQMADIPVFKEFIAKNLKTVSSDPFLSSTYRPGDKWYEILGYLQHGRHDLAVKLLEPLAEAEDPEAMFWLAKTRFASSIENIGPAYDFYVKAANMGQPYAALALTSSDMYCERYFGHYCKESWGKVALKSFTKLAKKGDVRAQYYLAQREPLETQEQRNAYLKKLMVFAEQGYYQPLFNYAMQIIDIIKPPEKLQELSVNLLKVGANRNFIPSISNLVNYSETIASIKIDEHYYIKKGANLGSNSMLGLRFYVEMDKEIEGDKELTAVMLEELKGSSSYISRLYNSANLPDVTEAELVKEKIKIYNKVEAARKKVKAEIAKMDKMLYLDGFTDRSDWTKW